MADTRNAAKAAPSTKEKAAPVTKPERPDEEAYKAELSKAEKDLKAAEERLVSLQPYRPEAGTDSSLESIEDQDRFCTTKQQGLSNKQETAGVASRAGHDSHAATVDKVIPWAGS